MVCRCLPLDYDDHVWRFRNEQAGYHAFARRHYSHIPTRYSVRLDINALDPDDPMHRRVPTRLIDDDFDYNYENYRNGDHDKLI
jgi:hypothetical protein